MTAAIVRPRPMLVLDMSALRFRVNKAGTSCATLSPRQEILAQSRCVYGDGGRLDIETTAYVAMDAALASSALRYPTDGGIEPVRYEIALYDPYTAAISMGPVPDTVTVCDHEPVALPAEGLLASGVPGGRDPRLELPDGRIIRPEVINERGMSRMLAAHAA